MNKVSWGLTIAVIIWTSGGALQPIHEPTVLAMNLQNGDYGTNTWEVGTQKTEHPAAQAIMTAADGSASSAMAATAQDSAADFTVFPPLLFHTVNGLSLTDDLKTVYEMKGQPSAIIQDEILTSLKTYQFEDCSITMIDGSIEYVAIPGTVQQLDIDGQRIPMDLASMKKKLGTPYFVSEDGIVYRNGANALKIYLDPATNKIMSVHYFHTTSQ